MDIPNHFPTGDEIIESWTPLDETDIGLIPIPDSPEPVMIEWQAYEHPEDPQYGVQYLGQFTCGGEPLEVKERFEYIAYDGERTAKLRFRGEPSDYAGCSELVHVLAAGQTVPLECFESGAYRGLWYSDVFHSRRVSDDPEDGVEETACRAIFILGRATVLLFRSLYLDNP